MYMYMFVYIPPPKQIDTYLYSGKGGGGGMGGGGGGAQKTVPRTTRHSMCISVLIIGNLNYGNSSMSDLHAVA